MKKDYFTYELYLFSHLFKLFKREFDKMPIDEQFVEIKYHYQLFLKSGFNNSNKSLSECMGEYLIKHINCNQQTA